MHFKRFYITYYIATIYKYIINVLPNAVLIFCFGLSSTNLALADQIIKVSPIIVQPEDLRDINQQMIAQDRINRDQELAIRGLIDENQKLTDTALARKQDATLEKINQTLKNYRDALLSRDRARIAANSQAVSPRYRDLVNLTENIDDMKEVGKALAQKSNVIGEKYKILTELKDEMKTLNGKLKGDAGNEEAIKTPPQQEDKIQLLTNRLGEMDQKIARYDQVLAEKDRQISQLKDNVRWLNQVLAAEKNKAEYFRLTSLHRGSFRPDDRIRLAKQLISLQERELALLEEKNRLWGAQSALYDQHVLELENRIKGLMAERHMKDLQKELGQKEQQMELLKSELENKITAEKDKDDQIASLRAKIRSGQVTGAQTDSFKRQIAQQQDNVDLLKQELEGKVNDSNKMTLLISDYQKKLEAKNNDYNELLGQIAGLKAQLQLKEAQVIKIKRDLKEDQSKELDLSMVQQKAAGAADKEYQDKIKSLKTELALERQQLEGMPSSDEIGYLRSGLTKATLQLKQKDEMLAKANANAVEFENEFKAQSLDYQNLKGQLQSAYAQIHRDTIDIKQKDLDIIRLKERYTIATGDTAFKAQLKQKDELVARIKANADEYERKYKEQSKEFQSLKVQLQDALDEISRKDEDLKYKNMEIIRLKERSPMGKTKAHENKGEGLQEQLDIANRQIRDLQDKLGQLSVLSKDDVIRQKLKQALDEIDEQGRVINILVSKLQDAGQSVNLSQYLGKKH